LLEPKYNILKVAGSRLGSKHSEKTKMKISRKGVNHPLFGLEHSIETRNKIGESLKLYCTRTKKEYPSKSSDTKLKISLNCKGVRISVYDKKYNFIVSFPTITSAAKYLNISPRTMSRRLTKGYCNKYIYVIPE